MNPIEQAKANGDYRRAGQLQALAGLPRNYGCHYGVRSTLDTARTRFNIGYYEVNHYLTKGDTATGGVNPTF